MSTSKPAGQEPTYSEALASARESVSRARVSDPGEHFPYKAAEARALMSKNPAMGPGGPKDGRVRAEDVMSKRIADASEAYIAAQKHFLLDPTGANQELYDAAKDDLVAARRAHRRTRVDADGNPVGAVIGETTAPVPGFLVEGLRHRRAGEEG